MPYYRRKQNASDSYTRDDFQNLKYSYATKVPPDNAMFSDLDLDVTYHPAEDFSYIPYNEEQFAHMVKRVRPGGQIPMFEHHYTPPKASVEGAFGTEKGRVHFPILLGIAQNDVRNRLGVDLTPSPDLSPHSLKFVKHAVNRGLIPDSPELPDEPTNVITFEEKPIYVSRNIVENLEEIPAAEVKKGKQTLRTMLGRDKPLSKQFEQHKQLSFFDE